MGVSAKRVSVMLMEVVVLGLGLGLALGWIPKACLPLGSGGHRERGAEGTCLGSVWRRFWPSGRRSASQGKQKDEHSARPGATSSGRERKRKEEGGGDTHIRIKQFMSARDEPLSVRFRP